MLLRDARVHRRKEFERNCAKAKVLQDRVYDRWQHQWKVLVFCAIRECALVRGQRCLPRLLCACCCADCMVACSWWLLQEELRLKRAAMLYKRVVKRGYYFRWKVFWTLRTAKKREREAQRKLERAEAEKDEREAEAERLAAELAAKAAAEEKERKDKLWEENMQKARKQLKQRGIKNVRGGLLCSILWLQVDGIDTHTPVAKRTAC